MQRYSANVLCFLLLALSPSIFGAPVVDRYELEDYAQMVLSLKYHKEKMKSVQVELNKFEGVDLTKYGEAYKITYESIRAEYEQAKNRADETTEMLAKKRKRLLSLYGNALDVHDKRQELIGQHSRLAQKKLDVLTHVREIKRQIGHHGGLKLEDRRNKNRALREELRKKRDELKVIKKSLQVMDEKLDESLLALHREMAAHSDFATALKVFETLNVGQEVTQLFCDEKNSGVSKEINLSGFWVVSWGGSEGFLRLHHRGKYWEGEILFSGTRKDRLPVAVKMISIVPPLMVELRVQGIGGEIKDYIQVRMNESHMNISGEIENVPFYAFK